MKIRVLFTIDVPEESVAALIELAAAKTRAEAAEFVRYDAKDYVIQYLSSNGINDIEVKW